MKQLIVCVVLCLLTGCQGPMAVSGFGSSQGDAGVSVGTVIDGKAEVGVTGIAYAAADNEYNPSAGVYALWLVPTDPLIPTEEWQPVAGGAITGVLEDGKAGFIPRGIIGVIKDPHDKISLFALAETSWPTNDIDAPEIRDREGNVFGWFGARYRIGKNQLTAADVRRREAELLAKAK